MCSSLHVATFCWSLDWDPDSCALKPPTSHCNGLFLVCRSPPVYFQPCTTHQSSSFDWLRYGIFPLMSILRIPQSWQLSGVFTGLSFPRVEPFNSLQRGGVFWNAASLPWGAFLPLLRWFPAPLFVWPPGFPHFLPSSGQLVGTGLVASSSPEPVN